MKRIALAAVAGAAAALVVACGGRVVHAHHAHAGGRAR